MREGIVKILGLFLNSELRTGGHRRYLELMEGLAARGNDTRVMLNTLLEYKPSRFEPIGVELRYKRGGFPPASVLFRRAALGAARAATESGWKPDFILIHGETHLLAGLALRKALGAPLLFGHRSNAVREGLQRLEEGGLDLFGRMKTRIEVAKYRGYERLVARRVDLAVFQSAYDRDDFLARTGMGAEAVAVIGGNIGGPRFKREQEGANKSASMRHIVFVGTYGPRKGVRYLVEAIGILAKSGLGDLRFELIGPGDEQRDHYASLIEKEGLAGMVTLRGRVPDPFPFIAGADLMIVPSVFDSYPDTVLEALHIGTPVIGSAVGGIPEMLVHEDLLFPPMDSMAIADRIERCVRDPAFYSRIRALCSSRRDYFKFDWAETWERAMAARLAARRSF